MHTSASHRLVLPSCCLVSGVCWVCCVPCPHRSPPGGASGPFGGPSLWRGLSTPATRCVLPGKRGEGAKHSESRPKNGPGAPLRGQPNKKRTSPAPGPSTPLHSPRPGTTSGTQNFVHQKGPHQMFLGISFCVGRGWGWGVHGQRTKGGYPPPAVVGRANVRLGSNMHFPHNTPLPHRRGGAGAAVVFGPVWIPGCWCIATPGVGAL